MHCGHKLRQQHLRPLACKYWDYIGVIFGLYQGYIRVILRLVTSGLFWDNGKENGINLLGFRVWDLGVYGLKTYRAMFWFCMWSVGEKAFGVEGLELAAKKGPSIHFLHKYLKFRWAPLRL